MCTYRIVEIISLMASYCHFLLNFSAGNRISRIGTRGAIWTVPELVTTRYLYEKYSKYTVRLYEGGSPKHLFEYKHFINLKPC